MDVPEDEIFYFQETLKMEKVITEDVTMELTELLQEPSPQIVGTETSLSVDHAEIDSETSTVNTETIESML